MKYPMFRMVLTFLLLLFVNASTLAWMDIFISPNGGFHPLNRNSYFTTGAGEEIPATVTDSLHDLIERTCDGGIIRIAMYAFDYFPTLEKLIEACRHRNIKVKLLLDASASWTIPARENLLKRLEEEYQDAGAAGDNFDFQVRLSTRRVFEKHGLTRKLDDGRMIYGTMHEKFGVFQNPAAEVPFGVFAGSANISWSASNRYAENRLFFLNEDAISRQYLREFGLLWNHYGEDRLGKCEDEIIRPAGFQNPGAAVYFNAQGHRLDRRLKQVIEGVSPEGTVDIAIFSFTKRDVAETILEQAELKRGATFRLLFDHSQIEDLPWMMGPWIHEQARERGLDNIEVRYKWRSNAYAVEDGQVVISHPKNLLLHHKMVIVDGRRLVTGSYNWSDSAEFRNLENLMIFDADLEEGAGRIINKLQLEFDYLWGRHRTETVDFLGVFRRPQVVTADFAHKLQSKIKSALTHPELSRMFLFLEPHTWRGATLDDIVAELDICRFEALEQLRRLRDKSLIRAKFHEGQVYYCESD